MSMTDKGIHDEYMDEVWALFAEDGREALDLVEETLLALEADPTDAGQVARLFRGLHTFKGNARMMGLSIIESLAHLAEDLVALVRDEGVALTGGMIDLLLDVLDHLRGMLDHAMAHRSDVEAAQVEELVLRLRATLGEYPKAALSFQRPSSEDVDEDVDEDMDEREGELVDEMQFPKVEESGQAEAPVPVPEIIDPATDPEYVRIFMEMAEHEMDRLYAAVGALVDGSEEVEKDCIQTIEAVVDTLRHAAGRMGYERIVGILDALAAAVEDWDGDARIVGLERLEQALSQELAAIQGGGAAEVDLAGLAALSMAEVGATDQAVKAVATALKSDATISDVSSFFKRWCTRLMRANLARLDEVVNDLEQCFGQFLTGGCALERHDELIAEAGVLLRTIHYDCVFHQLHQATHMTLALQDLYGRAVRGEMVINQALLDLTRTYVDRLGDVLQVIAQDESPEPDAFEAVLNQAEELLCLHTESQISRVTRDLLGLLDLSLEFEEVITPENLIEISQALAAGANLYTVLADLNQDEELGRAFYEWSRSDTVRLITNVTVFQDDRTLFNFLLATPDPEQAILEAFAEMDPQRQHLSLEVCTWREKVDLEGVLDKYTVQRPSDRPKRSEGPEGTVSAEALAGFLENVGELAASRATLHRVTQRLTESDLVDTVTQLVKRSYGDWQRVRKELQASLVSWTFDLSTLSQLEAEMGAALDRFQEVALSLRARPAAEILEPLQRLVQDVAQHQGKLVELELEGADTRLDHGTLDVLAEPLRRLVWLAVAHGIERPVQRREAGKPIVGRVSIAVTRMADRVRVTVEDDGCGVGEEAALDPAQVARARDEGVDLAAVGMALSANGGSLSVTREPQRGTRFSLDLPLHAVMVDGMVMRAAGVHYVVPIEAVRRIVRPEETQVVYSSADGGQRMLRLEEELVPIRTVIGSMKADVPRGGLLLVVEQAEKEIALIVDELIGQQQVFIQPLQGHLADLPSVSGCALLGEGDVGMVLNLSYVNT
jgi:two-component system chemotaxis sensor kinase CheA